MLGEIKSSVKINTTITNEINNIVWFEFDEFIENIIHKNLKECLIEHKQYLKKAFSIN